MDMKGSDVIKDFAVADTGAFHYRDLLYLWIRNRIHYSFLIRQCVPSTAFCT